MNNEWAPAGTPPPKGAQYIVTLVQRGFVPTVAVRNFHQGAWVDAPTNETILAWQPLLIQPYSPLTPLQKLGQAFDEWDHVTAPFREYDKALFSAWKEYKASLPTGTDQ